VSPSATALAPAKSGSTLAPARPAAARQTTGSLEDRRQRARELGRALGSLLDDADALASGLRTALVELSDEPYRKELRRVAPGIADVIGVRNPLISALESGLRPALHGARPAEALFVAERLSRADELELRQVSLAFLRRSLADDPERTWQLMRRLGRRAADWISVDSLAGLFAEGILREPFRWAEIEQLVYAESPWERRLAASTVAALRSRSRELAARGVIAQPLGPSDVSRGLDVLASLLGDADPNVRKALSWALRELSPVDRAQVTAFVTAQAKRAASQRDGNRAWVIRDALSKLDMRDAHAIRERLAGIRRTRGGASTSTAAAVTGRFGRLPDPRSLPEPPL
jgi:3-methyladenine DNA glycosylase AlkD